MPAVLGAIVAKQEFGVVGPTLIPPRRSGFFDEHASVFKETSLTS